MSAFRTEGADTDQHVVAAVVMHRQKICLLRRSFLVDSDRGRWMCVTGYLPSGEDPLFQARTEVQEEMGLAHPQLRLVREASAIHVQGDNDAVWTVSPFLFEADAPAVTLNWENDDVLWLGPTEPLPAMTTAWLPAVLSSLSMAPRAV
jgi:ADP-ribose pyrophosphatase